jgi:(2Fe-2S) ferredoxin
VTVLVVDKDGANYYGRIDPELGEALVREQIAGEGAGEALRRHRLRPENLLDLSALGTTKTVEGDQ